MRGLFFDLDNTLIDMQRPFDRWLSSVAPNLNDEQKSRAQRRNQMGYSDRLRLCRWLVDTFELKMTPDALWHDMRSRISDYVEPNPAVLPMLERYREQFEIALVTNGGSENQRAKIDAAGLASVFESERIFVSGELPFEKPDAEIFAHVCETVGVEAEQCWFVGDHPNHDARASRQFGLTAIWVSHGRSWEKASQPETIVTIEDLPTVIPWT